jgi:AbrB family looped-hinge helix DNA binding protein
MRKNSSKMEIARISSKGQLVIPQDIRKKLNIKTGNLFAIASDNEMLILKKLKSPVSKTDINTLKIVSEAWQDIEEGKCRIEKLDDFIKEAKKW